MILILSFLSKRNGKLVRSAEGLTVQHVCLFVLPLHDQGANELRLASPSGGNAMGQRTPCLGQNYPKSRLDSGDWPVVLKDNSALQNQKNFPLHSKMIIVQPWFSPQAVNLMNIQLLLQLYLMSPPDVQAHLVKKTRINCWLLKMVETITFRNYVNLAILGSIHTLSDVYHLKWWIFWAMTVRVASHL